MKKGDMEWSTIDEMWNQVKSRSQIRAAVLIYVDEQDNSAICTQIHGWSTEALGLLEIARRRVLEDMENVAPDDDDE